MGHHIIKYRKGAKQKTCMNEAGWWGLWSSEECVSISGLQFLIPFTSCQVTANYDTA